MGSSTSHGDLSIDLPSLPKPLLPVAAFIRRIECDIDFLVRMHRYRVTGNTEDSIDYVYYEGFHGYDLRLYWPILQKWALQKWRHDVTADERTHVISFRVSL